MLDVASLFRAQAEFKYVDDLASVWCEAAELELKHKNYRRALELMRTATAVPRGAGGRRTKEEMEGPVQVRVRCWYRPRPALRVG